MKRLLIIFILAFIPSLACADVQDALRGVIARKNATSCGLIQSQETTSSITQIGNSAATQYFEGSFTSPSGTNIVRTLYLRVRDAGNPTGLTVALCTDSSGAPGVCTNADAALTGTTSSMQYLKVNFAAGYSLASATKYHIRAYYPTDAVNYYEVSYYNSVATEETSTSSDGAAWSSLDSTSQILFRITSCLE